MTKCVDKKKKTSSIFCSRNCAGHDVKSFQSSEVNLKIRDTLLIKNKYLRENAVDHPNTGVKRLKYKCIYCNKYFSKNNIVRWHNENCRYRLEKVFEVIVQCRTLVL